MSHHFFKRLEELSDAKNSLLCVGLDPRLPEDFQGDPKKYLIDECSRLMEATASSAICFKPNIAFFEAHGIAGMEALEKIISLSTDIPMLLDAKRGDIGPTAQAYASAAFGQLKADAITLAPYMGYDSVKPFLDYEDKGMFLLCRTSNPSSPMLQDLVLNSGELVYERAAAEMTAWGDRIGLVVAGNDPVALKKVRAQAPDAWFLAPGIGAQGGTADEAFAAGARKDGKGLLVNSSRGIAQADDPAAAAKSVVEQMQAASKKIISSGYTPADPLKKAVLKGLIDTECFKTGEFTLKSGKTSPFYIDLRRVQSDPKLLKRVAQAYATLLEGLEYDCIAGIPVAALPLATAVSLEAGIPLIYPRMTMKAHGTGNKVEGEWKPGDRVALLDDLITTGKSKVEAVDILKSAGLIVEDLIVLIERGVQGRQDMEAAGINLFSYCGVEELLDQCREMDKIDDKQLLSMKEYARS